MKLDNKGAVATGLVVALGVAISVSLFLIFMPFIYDILDLPTISLPDSIVTVISSVKNFFYMVGYFIPIPFILSCLLFILVFRQADFIFSIINWLYDRVRGK